LKVISSIISTPQEPRTEVKGKSEGYQKLFATIKIENSSKRAVKSRAKRRDLMRIWSRTLTEGVAMYNWKY